MQMSGGIKPETDFVRLVSGLAAALPLLRITFSNASTKSCSGFSSKVWLNIQSLYAQQAGSACWHPLRIDDPAVGSYSPSRLHSRVKAKK